MHFSQFFNKKYWYISDINNRNFNETLTNNIVSFEQPGPVVQSIVSLKLLVKDSLGLVVHIKWCADIFRVTMVRENIWTMKFFPVQGKVREFCGWPRKFRKDLESQGKAREFENKWLWQAVFRKFIYSVQEGKGCGKSELFARKMRTVFALQKLHIFSAKTGGVWAYDIFEILTSF